MGAEQENEKITMIVDGVEKTYDLLFTFDSPDTNRGYFGYTDHSVNKEGKLNIYAAYIDPLTGKGPQSITDPDELAMVNEVIKEIQRRLEAGE